MKSEQSSIAYPGTKRYRLILYEVLEAYQVFLANASYRIAWRNLAVFLTSYLVQYFRYDNGLPQRAISPRTRYLMGTPNTDFGCLVVEVVYVLLFKSDSLPDERAHELRPIADNKLLSVCEIDLHRILLDITIELNHISTRSIDVPSDWNPLECVFRNEQTYPIELLLDERNPSTPLGAKPTFLDTSRNLLRRALSARRGVSYRLRKPVAIPKGLSIAPTGPAEYSSEETLVSPESPMDIVPKPIIGTVDLSQISQGPSQAFLHPIPEETYPDRINPSSRAVHRSVSVRSHSTLDSFLDFYEQSSGAQSNTSVHSINSAARRITIDGTQLSRNKYLSVEKLKHFSDDARSATSGTTGNHSFITAESHISIISREEFSGSNRDSVATFLSITTAGAMDGDLIPSPYYEMLQARSLIPERTIQTDWSGRGQHTEYHADESHEIPLHVESVLGQTRNAVVESVRCRRIRLVRKTIRCTKWSGLKLEDVIQEVQHLYRVQHSHIVRLVGTYAMGPNLAILTYPCAEWNLESFMRATRTIKDSTMRCKSLRQFFTCLAKVLDFMHSYPLKHMDIKPQNLLVRDIRDSPVNDSDPFKIYFTDFGISRSYDTLEECETETPTSFTRTYAAVEVVLQEARGLSADVFSLGCVYAEMIATVLDVSAVFQEQEGTTQWEALHTARGQVGDMNARPYYSTVDSVCSWLSTLTIREPEKDAVRGWTLKMLHTDASSRPTARQIADDPHLPFACLSCTLRTGPEDFECALPLHEEIQTP